MSHTIKIHSSTTTFKSASDEYYYHRQMRHKIAIAANTIEFSDSVEEVERAYGSLESVGITTKNLAELRKLEAQHEAWIENYKEYIYDSNN